MSEERERTENPKIPHKAVILYRMEVVEQRPDGKLIPSPLHTASEAFVLLGNSFEEAREKAEKLFTIIRNEYDKYDKNNQEPQDG